MVSIHHSTMGSPNENGTSDATLPSYGENMGYTATPTTVEHLASIKDKRNRPWLTLKVRSRAPSALTTPYILEGEPVVGTVVLDLGEDTKIKSITVKVC